LPFLTTVEVEVIKELPPTLSLAVAAVALLVKLFFP